MKLLNAMLTLLLVTLAASGQTRNFRPASDGEGELGTATYAWRSANVNTVNVDRITGAATNQFASVEAVADLEQQLGGLTNLPVSAEFVLKDESSTVTNEVTVGDQVLSVVTWADGRVVGIYVDDGDPNAGTGGEDVVSDLIDILGLPVYAVTEPTTSYAPGIDMFTVANAGTLQAGVPEIAEWTRQADAGDAITLTAENLDNANTMVLCMDVVGDLYICDVIIDGRQAAVTLPDAITEGLSMLWVGNSNGFSEPVPVNRADLNWISFGTVSTGETFYALGQNLESDGTNWLYNATEDEWLASASTNGYRGTFVVPAGWAVGTHVLYAHNGTGGKYGWSDPVELIVEEKGLWTGNTYDIVANFGADGTDGLSDQAAFDSCVTAVGSNPRSTVNIPAGTYHLGQFKVRTNTRYIGAGSEQTFIMCDNATSYDSFVQATYGCALHGVTLVIDPSCDDDKAILFNETWSHDAYFEDVVFLDEQRSGLLAGFMTLDKSERHHFKNCTFSTSQDVYCGSATDTRFEDCSFVGILDQNQMVTLAGNKVMFLNCVAKNKDMSDASEHTGWAKGRWLVMTGPVSQLYMEGCRTESLLPRDPTPFLENVTVTSVGAYSDEQVYWYGTYGEQVFTISEDIPDELHGRGNDSITYSGAQVDLATNGTYRTWFRVRELDATNNTVTVQVASTAAATYPAGTPSSTWTISLKDITDQNSGEQILYEGAQIRQTGAVLSSTSNKVTIATSEASASGVTASAGMFIVGGKGVGQSRVVNNFNVGTGEVQLTENWRVIPDATSTYMLGGYVRENVFYKNDFSGRASGVGGTASTALQIMCSSGIIMDSNTFTNLSTAIHLYGYYSENSNLSTAVPNPNYFFLAQDNKIVGAYDGFRQSVLRYGSRLAADGDMFSGASVLRGNSMTGISGHAYNFVSDLTNSGLMGMNMVQDASLSGMSAFTAADGFENTPYAVSVDAPASKQVIADSTFAGVSGANGVEGSSVTLRDVNFSGFSTNYTDSFTALTIPRPVVKDVDTAEVWNTGTESGTATVSETGQSLTIPAGGSATATGLSVGIYTVTLGSESKTITVQ